MGNNFQQNTNNYTYITRYYLVKDNDQVILGASQGTVAGFSYNLELCDYILEKGRNGRFYWKKPPTQKEAESKIKWYLKQGYQIKDSEGFVLDFEDIQKFAEHSVMMPKSFMAKVYDRETSVAFAKVKKPKRKELDGKI